MNGMAYIAVIRCAHRDYEVVCRRCEPLSQLSCMCDVCVSFTSIWQERTVLLAFGHRSDLQNEGCAGRCEQNFFFHFKNKEFER